jgi:mRNA interferase MazF
MMQPSNVGVPLRGEIWSVNFNSPITAPTPPNNTPKANLPTTGDEIYKIRPVVVMNISIALNLKLVIVVPFTSWQSHFQTNNYFWMIKVTADTMNRLSNDSAANIFQVQSISTQRIINKIGVLTTQQMDLISATIAFCIDYNPPKQLTPTK